MEYITKERGSATLNWSQETIGDLLNDVKTFLASAKSSDESLEQTWKNERDRLDIAAVKANLAKADHDHKMSFIENTIQSLGIANDAHEQLKACHKELQHLHAASEVENGELQEQLEGYA